MIDSLIDSHKHLNYVLITHLHNFHESEYWLELLIESGYYGDRAILEQCVEVKKLLVASIKTAKHHDK